MSLNSAEIALKLVDKARQMGLPVRMEASLVLHSDSRYVVLFPGRVSESTIRVSSHIAYEDRYGLMLDAKDGDEAVRLGLEWLEKEYGNVEVGAPVTRNGVDLARVSNARSSRAGRQKRGERGGAATQHSNDNDRLRNRMPRRVRGSGPLKERPRGEAQRICFELSGDD